MKRPRGRPRLPVEWHLLRGTYRRDRHGPLPAVAGETRNRPVTGFVPAGAWTGQTLIEALSKAWQLDDPMARVELEAAAVAYDRGRTLDALLDGSDGLIAKASTGAISARVLEVITKARTSAAAELRLALDRLDLEPALVKAESTPVSKWAGLL
jgi:hypothetical protein